MNGRKVISSKNLPASPPLGVTLGLSWLLERLDAPGWAWGVFVTLMGIFWLAIVVDMWTCRPQILYGANDE